jgi:hydroxymethylpyrimidine/phosphomethylpyrimidine kinase
MKKQNQSEEESYPVALTIAGSDSGGGAGIQADLRTFSAFGVFGTSAITAVTAQNPCEVRNITDLSPNSVEDQIEAVFAKFAVTSVKTGMLHNKKIIESVAKSLKGKNVQVIVDPVMISTSGVKLLEDDAIESLKELLFPLADWVTPNIPEAETILNIKINSLKELKAAAKNLAGLYNTSIVLKGGHAMPKGNNAVDIVSSKGNVFSLSSPIVELAEDLNSTLTHGTGCTFSAAMAAGTALGLQWKDMLISAKAFVYGSLIEGVKPGKDIVAMYPPAGTYRDKVKIQ